jgi:uncharacterized MAPEG superfamily protein
MSKQETDHTFVTVARRNPQRSKAGPRNKSRQTAVECLLRVGAARQQNAHNVFAAFAACDPKRS